MSRSFRMVAAGLFVLGTLAPAHAGYIVTMGPIIAPAGPIVFPYAVAHPANTLGVVPIGARVGVPPPFVAAGLAFNGLIFPRPMAVVATLLNTTPPTGGVIVVRDDNPGTPGTQLTGFDPGTAVTFNSIEINQGGQTYSPITSGVIDVANLGTIPEIADAVAVLTPQASGQVAYATFQFPEPASCSLLAVGALLALRRRRGRRSI
ncbi:MAG: hypothetical protein U1A27_04260 [Phycisphaerae bacterium]